jgi:serine/threonine protein kinase
MIHNKSLLHLDIKPSNIHLRPGGSPLLLDFGAVHRFDESSKPSKTSQVVTPGFSPLEQYYSKGKVGPYSDVYAIGASMRACIEGKSPPTSVERHAKDTMVPAAELFSKRYPAYLLEAIDWAMEIKPEKRPQSSVDLLKALIQGNNADSVPLKTNRHTAP